VLLVIATTLALAVREAPSRAARPAPTTSPAEARP
jgi:hypothetical protein